MFDLNLDQIYCGPAPVPAELLMRWNLDVPLLAALLLMAIAFRASRPGMAGTLVLAIIFISPLCALSSALFSARVLHHVLLFTVAAPLLALALPARRPGGATALLVLSTVTLWVWHLPAFYDAALSNMAVYWVMQSTLLASAVAFWRATLHDRGASILTVLLILAGFMQMGLLGALLTFAPEPIYAAHAVAPFAWGLTPLADQQFGGLIMWVPAGLPYAILLWRSASRVWKGAEAA